MQKLLALAGALEALQGRNAEQDRTNARLLKFARTVTLTGLYNHHHFEEVLDAEVGRARRNASALCAVMVDLGRFKSVTTTWDIRSKKWYWRVRRIRGAPATGPATSSPVTAAKSLFCCYRILGLGRAQHVPNGYAALSAPNRLHR